MGHDWASKGNIKDMDFFGPPYDHGWINEKGKFLRYNPGNKLNHDEVAQHFGKDGEDDALQSGWVRFSVTGNLVVGNVELFVQMLLPNHPPVKAVTQAIKEWSHAGYFHFDIWDGETMQNKSFRAAREAIQWVNQLNHGLHEMLTFRQWVCLGE